MPYINKPKKKSAYHKAGLNSIIATIYNSKQWKKLRNAYLMRHPLCQKCLEQGIITPAEEVHHIIPISKGNSKLMMQDIAYNPDNLMSLCKQCHHLIHQQMKK